MMKKTIAILGEHKGIFPNVMQVLMKQDLRLLFVSEDEAKKLKISRQPEFRYATAEVEFLSCERDGCWEADMIVLVDPDTSSASLVEKIKEVATQKIVLVASEGKTNKDEPDLRELLPWSKVVEIQLNTVEKEFSLCSNNSEAKAEVKRLFEASGYQLK
ncbi:hypothetical protein HC174_05100 [Salinimicrobium sp. CDJ15-81-2]|nr:hypothetical protein [Salinimicrobium nanhaiense]